MSTVNVLVIEDDDLVARSYSRVLRAKGFSVTRAATVGEARTALRAAAWDAVLLDLSLPDGSGEDLLPKIRCHLPTAKIAVISGQVDSEKIVSLHGKVAVALPKPVSSASLVELVQKLVSAPRSKRAIETIRRRHGLTRSETNVLRATASGLDDLTAAKHIQCAEVTFRVHWANILKKCGLRRRRQLLASLGRSTACLCWIWLFVGAI
jgi:DNA-binding NarL/FixJ family response regulator